MGVPSRHVTENVAGNEQSGSHDLGPILKTERRAPIVHRPERVFPEPPW